MELISNFAGEISASLFGGKTNEMSPNIDLNDSTFSDLLEKKLANNAEETTFNIIDKLGVPAGLNIGDFDGNRPIYGNNNIQDIITTQTTESTLLGDFDKRENFSTSEVLTFFPSLFNNKPTMTSITDSGLFNFERKIAANSYGKYSKNVITDLNEFVTDTLKQS